MWGLFDIFRIGHFLFYYAIAVKVTKAGRVDKLDWGFEFMTDPKLLESQSGLLYLEKGMSDRPKLFKNCINFNVNF